MSYFPEAMVSLNPDLVWKCEGNDPTNETEFNSRVSIQTGKDNSLVVFGEINGTVVWEDISNEIDRLQAEYDAQEYARDRITAYPSTGDQLDYIYHNGVAKWKTDMIDPVKTKYPKG